MTLDCPLHTEHDGGDLWPALTWSWGLDSASCCSLFHLVAWKSIWEGSAAWACRGCSPIWSGCRWRLPVVKSGTTKAQHLQRKTQNWFFTSVHVSEFRVFIDYCACVIRYIFPNILNFKPSNKSISTYVWERKKKKSRTIAAIKTKCTLKTEHKTKLNYFFIFMSTHSLLWQRFLFFLSFSPISGFSFLFDDRNGSQRGRMSILLTLKLKSQDGEILWYQTTWGWILLSPERPVNTLTHLHWHLREPFPGLSDDVSQSEDGAQGVVSSVAVPQVGVVHLWEDVPSVKERGLQYLI